jgi:ATP-dependent protease Clp ATPase subunit
MFEMPSRDDIKEVVVSREMIQSKIPPVYVLKAGEDKKSA